MAGSLLLACATRDPAVRERCCPSPSPRPSPPRPSPRRDSSRSGDRSTAAAAAVAAATAFGAGDDYSHSPFVAINPVAATSPAAASVASSSWEEGDDFDGSGEDESKVRGRFCGPGGWALIERRGGVVGLWCV